MSHEPCASRFRFAVSLRGFLLELMSGSSSPRHPKLPRRPATFQLPVPFSVTQAPIAIDDTECAATYKPAPHCGAHGAASGGDALMPYSPIYPSFLRAALGMAVVAMRR
jgi:hypothetical protein